MRKENHDSIWKIWSVTSKFRKKNTSNYLIVATFSILSLTIVITNDQLTRMNIRDILSLLIGLNGAILGLIIAGYSFSNAIPRDLMSFFASTKAKDYPWSNFKQILLNYLYCYTVLFTGILIFCFCYLLTFLDIPSITYGYEIKFYSKKILFVTSWLVQGFIISELKIFLFWIYDNSLTLAQATAIADDKDPFDEGNS